jgi:hypothetical protein
MQTAHFRRILYSISFMCLALAPAAMANQVVNGGFEDFPDFTGWTVNDPSGFTLVGHDPAFAHSGNNKAFLGATGLLGTLSQNVMTSAGTGYTLSFFLANDGGAPPNEFDVFWNGVEIFSEVNAPHNPSYTNFTFSVVGGAGASTPLVFQYRNDADFFRLDDVSVGVPDTGSTLWMALPVVGALVILDRSVRRRRIFA